MSIVLDYTSRINPVALKQAGAIGVSRYLSFLPNPKVILQPEYDELINAGVNVTLNWEYRALDWTGGSNAAAIHAGEAVRQANARGYRKGKVITGSADFDMTPAQWDSAGKFYAATYAREIRNGGFRPGVYGPWDVLQWVKDAGYMDAFWQSMSTSHSSGRNAKPWPGAHLRQRAHLTVGGIDTDYSDILILPLWGGNTGGTDFMISRIAVVKAPDGSSKYYLGDGIWYTVAITWNQVTDAQGEGAKLKNFNEGDDWLGHVGRNLAGSVTSGGGTTLTVTQEMLNAAVAANVAGLGTALASHLKVV